MLGKRRSKRQSADDAKDSHSDDTIQKDTTNDFSTTIDLSGIPPPPTSTSRSDNRSTRDASPSQSLLDRYQRRIHGFQTTKHSSSSTFREQSSPSKSNGKGAAALDDLLVELGPASPESVNEPITPNDGMPTSNKMYDEFDFGLVNSRKTGLPPLTTTTNDATITQPPRRQTRSQAKAEQRKDSVSAESDKDAAYKPRSLTIRKVHDADWTPSPPRPAVAATSSQAEAELMASLASLGLESNTTTTPPNPSIVSHAKIGAPISNLKPTPLQPSHLPTATKTTIKTNTKPPSPPPQIPITFPSPPGPGQLPGYIWLSTSQSSSLPTEPWGWLKTWTCCQCAHQDPLGQGRAAQTMAEQRVCSRLVCGHVRCSRGCRVVRDGRFEGPGVFALG